MGRSDVETGRPIRAGDRFRIGSVTKTFVATVVLQLAAEGRLSLDDPVSRWLPGLLHDGDRITIRDLLAHRSGLADVADDASVRDGPKASWSPQRLIRIVDHEPRTARSFHYSSTNYLVLGLVVERATGHTVGRELSERIIRPLALTGTSYEPGRVRGPHVHGYAFPAHQGVVDPTAAPRDLDTVSARWAGASGDVVSSAADVARFLAELLGGKLLPAAQLRAMETTRAGYGLGLAVRETRCGPAWGHTGNLNGVLTIAWSTADGRRQSVVAANAYPLPSSADTALREAALAAFCD